MIGTLLRTIDRFTLLLLATVALASLLPARGAFATGVDMAAGVFVFALFFLHGAKLQRDAVVAGLLHWRLHLTVLLASFALFPLLGLGISPLANMLAPGAAFGAGLIYLCCLPSTVQSSIVFVSLARGNVAAAICAASASNLLGIAVTPLLVGVMLAAHGTASLSAIGSLVTQLLLPFLLGQALQARVGGWVAKNKSWLAIVDRGAILLMVYSAFSAAVLGGIWSRVSAEQLAALLVLCAVLLAAVLVLTAVVGRILGFSIEDRITIVFCGSKKSLVTGVPMANVLFPAAIAGTIVLPLMIFHQLQLIVCAVLARRYAARSEGRERPA
jgi:sodium/bile acid cotransporter 7